MIPVISPLSWRHSTLPGAALQVIVGMSDIATHSIRQADLKITGTVASDTKNGSAKYKLVGVLGHLPLH